MKKVQNEKHFKEREYLFEVEKYQNEKHLKEREDLVEKYYKARYEKIGEEARASLPHFNFSFLMKE